MFYPLDDKNIILNQISLDNSVYNFREIKPFFKNTKSSHSFLTIDKKGNILWSNVLREINNTGIGQSLISGIEDDVVYLNSLKEGKGISLYNDNGNIIIDVSLNLSFIVNNKFKDTEIYYKEGKIGLGRIPLYNYKFDIGVPENTLMTAFHVGDGKFGFSMGNGTSNGFIPEIIGMGSDENDPGLYFLGKAGNDISSNTPLIILDGRDSLNKVIYNRPILGVKTGINNDYKLLLDAQGKVGLGCVPQIYKMEVEGSIKAHDFILSEGVSTKELIEIITDQQKDINMLKRALKEILESL
ncbi:MAG: hypothetical protein ACOC1K_00560 [Nanoarchaeota archaeon]